MGASAWGQISTWTASSGTYTNGQEITGSTSGIIVMTLGNDDGWVYDSNRSAIVSRTQQTPTTTNNIPSAGGYVAITPVRTLNLSLTTYSSQSNCYVYMYDEDGNKLQDFREKAYNTHDYGTLEANKTYYIYGGGFKTAGTATNLEYVFFQKFTATTIEPYTIKFVDEEGNSIGKSDITGRSAKFGTTVYAEESDFASISYNGKDYAYKSGNDGLTLTANAEDNVITLVFKTATVANYTIKYVNASSASIADDAVVESYVGAVVTASSDKVPTYIWKNDVKYKYASGNDELTVSGTEEDDVITLVYNEAPKYNYSLTAFNGEDELGEIVSGQLYEGESTYAAYPKAAYFGGKWYEATSGQGTAYNYYNVSAEFAEKVSYTESDRIDYFFENENFTVVNKRDDGYVPDRASNHSAVRVGANGYIYTPALAAGIYTITVCKNNSNSGTATLAIGIRDSEGNVIATGKNAQQTQSSNYVESSVEEITVPEGSMIQLSNTYNGNNNMSVDYIILTKTGEANISATIGDKGWTTFASPYALDLSNLEGATAYYASAVGESSVTMTSTESAAVAAGEGLMLKGTAGATITIPVVASGTAIDGNLLKGCTVETVLAANASNYVLVNNEDAAEFQCLDEKGATIPAGKAYLNAGEGARSLSVVFADEATAVKSISAAKENGEVYNLAGQRVAAPQKGLYIVNGRKVIVK